MGEHWVNLGSTMKEWVKDGANRYPDKIWNTILQIILFAELCLLFSSTISEISKSLMSLQGTAHSESHCGSPQEHF